MEHFIVGRNFHLYTDLSNLQIEKHPVKFLTLIGEAFQINRGYPLQTIGVWRGGGWGESTNYKKNLNSEVL